MSERRWRFAQMMQCPRILAELWLSEMRPDCSLLMNHQGMTPRLDRGCHAASKWCKVIFMLVYSIGDCYTVHTIASASQSYDQAEAKGRLFLTERPLAAYIRSHLDRPTFSKSGGVFSAARMRRVCSNVPYLAVVASRFPSKTMRWTNDEVIMTCLHGIFSRLFAWERQAHWAIQIREPTKRSLASKGTRSLRPLS